MANKRGAAAPSKPDWSLAAIGRDDFIAKVNEQGAQLYRDLPWRNVDDAYAVLVSEVMLQQTQVARVIRYWNSWMERFPTVDALAAADTSIVLEAWQGLGYNRRALALKRACETCASRYGGTLPDGAEALMELPGIGPATAAGVVAFAYDKPSTYIETNVRSVFLHELFPRQVKVSDKTLAPYVSDTCPATGSRAWYYALLDYGSHLKTLVANPSRRSAHHARQGKFEGSRREKRSFVLKQVLASPEGIAPDEVRAALDLFERDAGRGGIDAETFESIVEELASEGFFTRAGELLVP